MSESGNWSAPDRFLGEDVELIDEIVLTEDIFDDDGDVLVDEVITIVDAEGDVMIEEHLVAADAQGDVLAIDSLIVLDGSEVDDRQLAAALRGELNGIERALEQLDAGTYGRCDSCGNAIEDAVLAVTPQARSCSAHLA